MPAHAGMSGLHNKSCVALRDEIVLPGLCFQSFPDSLSRPSSRMTLLVALKQLVISITRCLFSAHYGVDVTYALDIVSYSNFRKICNAK
jgi:hypothetical protein